MICKIAGLIVKIDSFGRTVKQAEPYIYHGDREIDFEVCLNTDKLCLDQPHLSRDDAEYISTGSYFSAELLKYHGFILHSSAVVVDGNAFLISAGSGVGKTTHTELWLKLFGDQAFILNDDKPALRLEDGVWYAYGTPWSGRDDKSVNARVPVAGIALLERAQENKIERVHGSQGVHSILQQSIRLKNPKNLNKLLDLVDQLLQKIPVWKLQCNMDSSAAIMAYEAMSGNKFTVPTGDGK